MLGIIYIYIIATYWLVSGMLSSGELMSYVSFVMVGSFNICDLENGEYLVISRDVEWGHGQQMLEIDVSFDVGSLAD